MRKSVVGFLAACAVFAGAAPVFAEPHRDDVPAKADPTPHAAKTNPAPSAPPAPASNVCDESSGVKICLQSGGPPRQQHEVASAPTSKALTPEGVCKERAPGAKSGNPLDMAVIGHCFEYGIVGLAPDYAAAMDWYRRAFAAGASDAGVSLARMYALGRGVAGSAADSADWLLKAARLGNAKAAGLLGDDYLTGTGVPKDMKKALQLHLMAAQAGEIESQIRLVSMFRDGVGTPVDLPVAYYWVLVARNARLAYLYPGLHHDETVLRDMIPKEQRETVEIRARDFKPGGKI